MNATHLRRSLAAVATAIACLVTMPNPAAATLHDVDLTGGVITLTKTGITPEVIDLVQPTSCTQSLVTDENVTTLSVASLNASHVHTFGTTSFLVVLTRSTTGNIAGALDLTVTPHTITSMRVAVVITIYNTTSCTPTGTSVCTMAILLHLNGTSTSVGTSNNFSLTGASPSNMVAFPTCTSGPSYFVGTTSTVTSPLVGHVLT